MRLAFLGCGKIARAHAAAAVAAGAKVAAASGREGSRNLSLFLKEHSGATGFSDWRELLRFPEADAFVVCAPWNEIENIAVDVMKTGKPCLLEKPLALTAAKAREISRSTQPFHTRAMVGFNRRFYEFLPLLEEAIQNEQLLSVDMTLPESVPAAAADHFLVYMTSHWLDLVSHLCGPLSVEYVYPSKNFQQITAVLSAQGGVPVNLKIIPGAAAQVALTFYFANKVMQLKPVECLTIYDRLEKQTDAKGVNSYHPHVLAVHRVDSGLKPGFLGQMRYFLETVATGKTGAMGRGCTVEQAVQVTELCEALGAKSNVK